MTRKKAEVWRPQFLEALRKSADVSLSARAAGISRRTAYDHKTRYEGFRKDWLEAEEEGLDHVTRTLFTAATQHEDLRTAVSAAKFILSRKRPEEWGERSSVDDIGPVRVELCKCSG